MTTRIFLLSDGRRLATARPLLIAACEAMGEGRVDLIMVADWLTDWAELLAPNVSPGYMRASPRQQPKTPKRRGAEPL